MSLKVVELQRPGWYPEKAPWDCQGVSFSIDESLRGVERDRVNYLAAGVHLMQRRLAEEGGLTPYEDPKAVKLLLEHWQACRPSVKGITVEGKELKASEVEDYLDNMELAPRGQLCQQVVAANELGRKNV